MIRALATGLVAVAASVAFAAHAGAQDAVTYTYVVRDVDRGIQWPGTHLDAPPEIDLSRDPNPMRVIQGPELTWVVPVGDSVSLRTAAMVLHRNVPLRPGSGELMLRGWPPAPSLQHDTVALELTPGPADREIAGRTARHYRLRAVVRRAAGGGQAQRLDYTAHLWILPDVPHSWAPFGFGARSLTGLAPRLRDRLDDRLAGLGLVGMAIIRLEHGSPGGETTTDRVRAFAIEGLEATDPPRPVGPVVDLALLEALDRRTLEEPGAVCPAVADGRLPAGTTRLDPEAVRVVLARLNDRCGSPELYFGLLEERLRTEPAAICGAVADARDATGLAEAVFTGAQRTAFLEFLTDTQHRTFLAELRRFCQDAGVPLAGTAP